VKTKLFLLLLGLVAFFTSLSAEAASYLPAIVGTSFAQITTDFNSLMSDNIWPLVILVGATFLIVKIFKKGVGAA
jgi:membrane-bound ClpP family serine protease